MTDLLVRKQVIDMLRPQISRIVRIDKRMLLFTMSNAAKRVRTDGSLADLPAWSISVTYRSIVLVKCIALNLDWLGTLMLFWER